jgi:hypothetical protein
MALERTRRKENRVGGDELWTCGAAKDSFLAGGTSERCLHYSFRRRGPRRSRIRPVAVMDCICCPDDVQTSNFLEVSISFIPSSFDSSSQQRWGQQVVRCKFTRGDHVIMGSAQEQINRTIPNKEIL